MFNVKVIISLIKIRFIKNAYNDNTLGTSGKLF